MRISEAARALGVAENTLRYWIREKGAPVVSPGSSGRGHGAELDLRALFRWRYEDEDKEALLRDVAQALQDVFIRDGAVEDRPVPVWRSLGLSKPKTALFLLAVYERIYRAVTGENLDDLDRIPEELHGLLTVYVELARRS